jgi:hypothetical protein
MPTFVLALPDDPDLLGRLATALAVQLIRDLARSIGLGRDPVRVDDCVFTDASQRRLVLPPKYSSGVQHGTRAPPSDQPPPGNAGGVGLQRPSLGGAAFRWTGRRLR